MHWVAHLGWIVGGCLTATLAVAETRHPDYQLPVLDFEQDAEGYYVNVSDEAYLRYMWGFICGVELAREGTRARSTRYSRNRARHKISRCLGDSPATARSVSAAVRMEQLSAMGSDRIPARGSHGR